MTTPVVPISSDRRYSCREKPENMAEKACRHGPLSENRVVFPSFAVVPLLSFRVFEAMQPTEDIEALIFDCDGTLADTMPLHFIAWQNVLTNYGFVFDEDLFYSLGGQPTERIVANLAKEQNIDVDVMKVTNEKESAFLDLIGEVEPVQPVIDVAHQFHGKLPMGVGSGGQREVVKTILKSLSIESLFDCVVGSEDTERHKPEPDVFLEVASRLKVEPSKCLVYEDADLGVESARRAGMKCIDVRTVHTPRRITPDQTGGD